MRKVRKGYACITTIDTDYDFGAPSIILYPTLKDLKSQRTCWKECGIYELEIGINKVVKKPKRTAI